MKNAGDACESPAFVLSHDELQPVLSITRRPVPSPEGS